VVSAIHWPERVNVNPSQRAAYEDAQERSLATGRIEPMTPATFYDFREELVTVPLITLNTWVTGLRLRVKHGVDIGGVEQAARQHLHIPKHYKVVDLLDHLEESLAQTNTFYGVGPP
jgi:hypothetical protein